MSMPKIKLHQVIALANGKKALAQASLTESHHTLQKAEPISGITRTYMPINDDGDKFPPESKLVQVRVSEIIDRIRKILTDMIDMVATQDVANTTAFANVIVDGVIVVKNVPATHLLFLEKRLDDLNTFVKKIPILDPAESWVFSTEMSCYATSPSKTIKTKKVPRNNVKYEATDKHPAQVETWMEDIPVGYWSTTKFSGAIPDAERRAMLVRIQKLKDAVQIARGSANSIEVENVSVAEKFLSYIFLDIV